MIFKKTNHLNPKILNKIADDLIEVNQNTQDKALFRMTLLDERLQYLNNQESVLTSKLITQSVNRLKSKDITDREVSRALKQLSKGLTKYYKQLILILKNLEVYHAN